MTQAYLVPTDILIDALKGAARSGVDVKIILPGFSDFWMPRYAGRFYYTELLDAGVKLYEMQGAMVHAKAAIVDGAWSTIGSTNLDLRGALHDDEVNAIIVSAEFAGEMERMFNYDLSRSKEIRFITWKNRPMKERLWEWVARVFKYWL